MPRIVSLPRSLAIWIFSNGHAPPHFHVLSPDTDAMIDLSTLRVLRGTFKRQQLSEALAWAAVPANKAWLEAEWRRLNDHD